jgi:hypothetical protein
MIHVLKNWGKRYSLSDQTEEPTPLAVPHREWHQFLILHSAYVAGEQTREIMSRLYIGEGTYNRTRRRALQGLANAVQEMDQGANRIPR